MTAIPRKYITDAKNQTQAVIVDLATFNRMEATTSFANFCIYFRLLTGDPSISGLHKKNP